MGQGITTTIRLAGFMITAIHFLPVRMIHATIIHVAVLTVTRILTTTHIARRSLQRLRCKKYKNGQENKFHPNIIHFQSTAMLWPGFFGKVPGQLTRAVRTR